VLLTFTLLPTLLSYALQNGTLTEKHKPWLERLQQRYHNALTFLLKRARLAVMLSTIPVVLALALAPRLGSEFLPKLDEGNIWLTVTLPTSAALDTTKQIEYIIRAKLLEYPEVAHIITQVGRPDDGSDPKAPNNLELLIDLKPRGEWRFSAKDKLVADMSEKLAVIPGISSNFSQVIQDNVEEALSGFRGEIVAKIIGNNLDILDDKGAEVAAVIQGIRGASDVASTRIGGQTEVVIKPDRTRLARYGISINDVNTLINQAMSGVGVTSFFEGDKRFDVVVRVNEKHRNAIDAIRGLQLSLPGTQVGNGPGTISLSDVASVEVRLGASRIFREAGSRMVIVKMNLLGRDQGSFVKEAQKTVAKQVKLPAGYSLTWGGQFENSQRATKLLMVIVPLTVLLIFSLLFWAFRSVRIASIILGIVPFTLVGGLAALGLAGLHLSVSAAVGFIAVAGISVQNGVIMLEEVVLRVREGAAVNLAITEGAVIRLRPILMTALMAGLGLLPAALSQGIGSETQRPFACVIVGGIVSGTVFTLMILPAVIRLFGDFYDKPNDPDSLADSENLASAT
jgi:cobalt-zinc-cadmium resistance protein CzcA